jgi:protein involved in polysaccharide export with SLBB domain
MKQSRNSLIFAIAILFFLVGCASQQPNLKPEAAGIKITSQKPQDYLIQPGDELEIKFFYNPEINEKVMVRPDGKISLQLVDEVPAAGLKPLQLDDVLTRKYAKELKNPMLTVIVRSFASQRIYVGGEVTKEGLVDLTVGMTPLQAVLNAGGFKETGNPESAIVIRKGKDNRPVPIKMNLKDVMYGKSGSADFILQPDDIVFVPKTAIAKVNKFVNQYIEDLFLFRGVSFGFSYEVHGDD